MTRSLLTTLLVLILAVLPTVAMPQTAPDPAALQAELDRRGINQDAFRARLATEGIDLTNSTPEELAAQQGRIESILDELEAEANPPDPTPTRAVDSPVPTEQVTTTRETAQQAQLPTSEIYGHNVFRNKSLQLYRTTTNPTPPNSYPLKAGDKIAVSIFGASQTDFVLTVDEEGFVTLPVGPGYKMPIAGVPIGEARALLSRRLSSFYTFREGQLSIRIQAAQTITVNIFGEVYNNGTYSISSLNTGFNALVAAGGPTDVGTVRNIQLIEGDQTVVLDVYDYLRNPVENAGLFLENNATIFVPLAENVIAVEGGVERPMFYELRAGETLADLIEFAGGTVPRAEVADIRVTRFVDGQLELFNVNLREEPGFLLQDDDLVTVPVISDPLENFVRIEGSVLLPGSYPIEDGMTLADLVRRGRLRPGARRDVAFLFRRGDDGTTQLERIDLAGQLGADAGAGGIGEGAEEIRLKRGDRIQILASAAYIDRSQFTITGAVRSGETTLPYPERSIITLEEAVLLAGGATPSASPEVTVVRVDPNNTEKRTYLRLNLLEDPDFVLRGRDVVTVYSQESFTDRRRVRISGVVRRSGEYDYDPQTTLADYIFLSGGLGLSADSSRIDIYRLEFDNREGTTTLLTTTTLAEADRIYLQPFDEVIVRPTADFNLIESVSIRGEVRYPGPYALVGEQERLTDLVSRAGGLTAEAFAEGATLTRVTKEGGVVVLNLDEVLANPLLESNMLLLPGDELNIPASRDLVTIYLDNTLATRFGADSTQAGGLIRVAYQGPRSAGWYINNFAGGFNDETARKRWTTVEYASGGVKETRNFLGIRNYPDLRPGAKIRVPAAPVKVKKERTRERFDWIQLVTILTTTATTLTTFFLLGRRN